MSEENNNQTYEETPKMKDAALQREILILSSLINKLLLMQNQLIDLELCIKII